MELLCGGLLPPQDLCWQELWRLCPSLSHVSASHSLPGEPRAALARPHSWVQSRGAASLARAWGGGGGDLVIQGTVPISPCSLPSLPGRSLRAPSESHDPLSCSPRLPSTLIHHSVQSTPTFSDLGPRLFHGLKIETGAVDPSSRASPLLSLPSQLSQVTRRVPWWRTDTPVTASGVPSNPQTSPS